MSTSKTFCAYVLEQLGELDDVTSRPMMGEFLLYYRGVLFGGIYDERLLIKEVPSNAKYNLPKVVPYEGAKRTMYYIEDLDDRTNLAEIIQTTYRDLPKKK